MNGNKTYPQGCLLTPKTPVALGRTNANPGQTFWVTNTTVEQSNTGIVRIARSGRNAGFAIPLQAGDIEMHFNQITSNPVLDSLTHS